MRPRLMAIGLLALAAALRPADAAAKDTHAAKPAAATAPHKAGAETKTAAAGGDAHAKPAAGAGAHAASGQGRPERASAGNDLPSVAARIKQRMQETVAARAQHAGPAAPAAGASQALHPVQAADASPAARRTTPAVEPARIRLSWRVGVNWPSELTEAEQPRPADGRIALSWR